MNEERAQICVATSTFYPNWEDPTKSLTAENIRGALGLETVKTIKEEGYVLSLVDGGSSRPLLDKLTSLGIKPSIQRVKGMSPGRQQSFLEASLLPGVKVISWTEPEKVSFVKDCLCGFAKAFLDDDADIGVPVRDQVALNSYPRFQIEAEMQMNRLWNDLLRQNELLSKEDGDIDISSGPKLIKNEPQVLELFLRRYRNLNGNASVNPDLWCNALIFPIIAALNEGFRVKNIAIPYLHPKSQTDIESRSAEYQQKRQLQFDNVMTLTEDFIRLLRGDPTRHLERIPNFS